MFNWLNKVLGFASWKLRGVVSAKDQCTGLQWLELQPRLVSAIQKRHRQQSSRMRVSIKNRKEGLHSRIPRIERPKAAHSVRECEARVPAGVHAPSWTAPFSDDTDNRSGGCTYQWMIQSSGAYSPGFNMCRVCFRETEDNSQSQKNRHSCSGWTTVDYPAFTEAFRDDTDYRSGGCLYSWYLDCQYSADVAKQH